MIKKIKIIINKECIWNRKVKDWKNQNGGKRL